MNAITNTKLSHLTNIHMYTRVYNILLLYHTRIEYSLYLRRFAGVCAVAEVLLYVCLCVGTCMCVALIINNIFVCYCARENLFKV